MMHTQLNWRSTARTVFAAIAMLFAANWLTACHTTQGLGQDLEEIGEEADEEIHEHTD